jgi:hypothetical protein
MGFLTSRPTGKLEITGRSSRVQWVYVVAQLLAHHARPVSGKFHERAFVLASGECPEGSIYQPDNKTVESQNLRTSSLILLNLLPMNTDRRFSVSNPT